MARSVVFNLIGNNRTGGAFRGAARDADRTADRVDHLGRTADDASGRLLGLGRSAERAGGRLSALTGRTASLAAGLLAIAPAAQAAAAAAVAGAGAMAAAYGAAGAALGAFSLAARAQLNSVQDVADAHTKAQDAVAKYGAGSTQAAAAQKEYARQLAALPPATRQTAKAFLGLRADYAKWSDSLAGDTMPIFTRGINIARGLLPKFTPLVKTGARELRGFMDTLAKGSKSGGLDRFIKRINQAAGPVLGSMLRSARNVGVGVAGIFEAFLPHAPGMARGIEGLTARFAKFGQSLKSSDHFRAFMDHVRQHLPAITELFTNLVKIAGNLAVAFAPMSGVSLTLVKNFTAMLAALPPEALTALATGFVAITTAVRILIPLQRTLNFILAANPIGLVVLALTGLALGLYVAYKRSATFRGIVQGAWHGVQDAAHTAWTRFIRPALTGMRDLFTGVKNTWQRIWPELQTLLDDAGRFFDQVLGPAVGRVVAAFGKLGGAAQTATSKISGVGRGFDDSQQKGTKFISWATIFGNVLGTIFLGPLGGIIGGFTGWFWPGLQQVWGEGFTGLGRTATGFWGWFQRTNAGGANRTVGIFGSLMSRANRTLLGGLPSIRNGWTGHWAFIHALAVRIGELTLKAIQRLADGGRRAFARGADAMAAAWAKLRKAARDPVNYVINTVYNDGIRRLWNKVIGWLHLPGGLQLDPVKGLERGGTLADPAPAVPMRTGGPMAIVGEGRRAYPEYVIPTDPRYRGRAQGLWAAAGTDLQMLAGGGVLGTVLGSVKKLAGKIGSIGGAGMALLADPGKVWKHLAAQMVPGAGQLAVDPWGTAVAAVAPKLLDQVSGAATQIIKTFKDAFGGDAAGVVKAAASMIGRGDDRGENNNWLTRAWGMPGAPWCAMFVSEAIKQAGATKRYAGYPSAAVASYVGAMRHVGRGEGQPGDLGAYYGTGHINVIARNLGGGRYETIGGNEGPVVKRSVRGGQTAILRPMATGGVLGIYQQRNLDPADQSDPFLRAIRAQTYDRGGWLHPGLTLAYNGTGRAEPVLALAKGGTTYRGTGGGSGRGAGGSGGIPNITPLGEAFRALIAQINRAMLSSADKINSYFARLGTTIRKYYSGGAEVRMLKWAAGLQKSMLTAATQAKAVADRIAAAKQYAADVTASAKEYASLQNLPARGAAADILTGLTERADRLSAFAGQITALKQRGLAAGLLQQIIGLGAGEGSTLAGLLLGADADTFRRLNAAQSAIDKAAGTLGASAADALYDSGKNASKGFLAGLYGQQDQLNRLMDQLGRRLAGGLRTGLGGRRPVPVPGAALRAASYDSGGMLLPGWTLAHNGTGRPESVIPALDSAPASAAGSGERHVHLHFDQIIIRDRADVDLLMEAAAFHARGADF